MFGPLPQTLLDLAKRPNLQVCTKKCVEDVRAKHAHTYSPPTCVYSVVQPTTDDPPIVAYLPHGDLASLVCDARAHERPLCSPICRSREPSSYGNARQLGASRPESLSKLPSPRSFTARVKQPESTAHLEPLVEMLLGLLTVCPHRRWKVAIAAAHARCHAVAWTGVSPTASTRGDGSSDGRV